MSINKTIGRCIKKVLLFIFISLVVLEIALRLTGVCFNLAHKVEFDKEADYKIFCVGESSTWGIGASDPLKFNYPRQLQEMLSQKFPGKKVRCYFDQTIGQNTSEILFKLPGYIKEYEPDLVIFMVGANNLWNLDKSNVLLFTKNDFISNATFRALIFLDNFRAWKLFKWIGYSTGLIEERWDKGSAISPKLVSPQICTVYEEEISRYYNVSMVNKVTEYDLGEMIDICRQNNVGIILCSYAGPDAVVRDIKQRLAKKYGLVFVDNYEIFENLPDKSEYLYKDQWHPNEKGYKLLAENIYQAVLENNFIE